MIHLLQEKDKKQKSMRPRIDKNRFQQIVKGILFFYKTPERVIIKKILPLSVGEGKRKKRGGGGWVTMVTKRGTGRGDPQWLKICNPKNYQPDARWKCKLRAIST